MEIPESYTPTNHVKIKAHKHFVWQFCYDDFKCARLQVPMDWQGGSAEANKTVEIAVIKIEATVSVTDPTYGGAVVLNPGTHPISISRV